MHHLHRTPRLPLVAVALVSLLTPLALAFSDAQASAAAPVLRLSTTPVPGNPLEVALLDPDDPPPSPGDCAATGGDPYGDLHGGLCQDASLVVSASAPVKDVTVTVTGRGLYVSPRSMTIEGIGTDTPAAVDYVVRARTTGLHTLRFEVTAPGVAPRSITLPYVWASGGPPLPSTDSLAGRLYGVSGLDSRPCGVGSRCTFRYSERLAFSDDTRVSRALARNGKDVCADGRCPTYYYDRSTGLVQVGRHMIGRVSENGAYFDGERYARMAYPRPGQRLDGDWRFEARVDEGHGIVEQRLVLRSDGRFRLRYVVDTHRYPQPPGPDTVYPRQRSGTSRIGVNGRLRLNDNSLKLTEVATLALITTPGGAPRPGTRGVWLDVPVTAPDGTRFIDGNRLHPLPSSVARD